MEANQNNLSLQEQEFYKLLEMYYMQNKGRSTRFPINDWEGFCHNYFHLRAGLSSLTKNPDTMNDPDFIELCNTWKHQSLWNLEVNRLEGLFNILKEKPAFKDNVIFNSLYGYFLKGVYLLAQENGYYMSDFFNLD